MNDQLPNKSDFEPLLVLLEKSSRTFMLNLPLLPSPLKEAAIIAYLLFRMADTIEDAFSWPIPQRVQELNKLIKIVKRPSKQKLVDEFAARYEKELQIPDKNHLAVLCHAPEIVGQLRALPEEYCKVITTHLIRTIKQMQFWVGFLARNQLKTLHDLRNYCYTAAGIPGEMLTSLLVLYSPEVRKKEPYLRALEPDFAFGLQLTNILKDCFRDCQEGRFFLPEEYQPLGERSNSDKIIPILILAYYHLSQGVEYVKVLPVKEVGIRKACFIPLVLAAATLIQLFRFREKLALGDDVKIDRFTVYKLLSEVERVAANNNRIQKLWERLTKPLQLLPKQFYDHPKTKVTS